MSNWKRIISLSIATASILAAETWTGWITDKKCASSNAPTGEVHKKHVESGEPVVFVNEADKKIYRLANAEKVMAMVGQKVTLTGNADGDAIDVQSATESPVSTQ